MFPSTSREAIVRTLVFNPPDASKGGWNLKTLSDALGLAPPTVLRHLENLAEAGVVERREVGPSHEVQYFARPYFQAVWVDPERGVFSQWTSREPFAWRFPLVSRIPDGPAQRTLLRLLPAAEKAGLLAGQDTKGHVDRSGPLPALAVFGSCARGDARASSDLDLLVRTETRNAGYRKRFKDVAAKVSLESDRPIQLRFMTLREFLAAPDALREALLTEAITVHLPEGSDEFLEGLHLFSVAAPPVPPLREASNDR